MGIKEAVQLISLEFKTDKLATITKTEDNGDKHTTNGNIRRFSIDINLKKTAALFALWVGILNAQLPSEVWIFLTKLAGN